jgi:hypothetical protein
MRSSIPPPTVQDPSIDSEDNRYHDTTGKSIHGSPYEILAPKLQHALVNSPFVMMNVHGFRRQGEAVDAVINCTMFERNENATHNCQAVSAFNPPKIENGKGPFGFISTPIFPANDPDTLVGFIFGAVFWSEVMEDMVRFSIQRIHCTHGFFGMISPADIWMTPNAFCLPFLAFSH